MLRPTHKFKAKRPWFGGDLQTLRNTFVGDHGDLSKWPTKHLEFQMQDGTGDRLFAALNKPRHIKYDCTIVLIHGMSGCSESDAMRRSAQFFLESGFQTLRLNLRGAGAYRKYARGTYHAGRSEDLAVVLNQLDPRLTQKLFIIGHSLGGNMLIKAMAEDRTHERSTIPIIGAASLCAPIDMHVSAKKFSRKRNYVYQQSILKNIRKSLSDAYGVSQRHLNRIAKIKTLAELDEAIVAPSLGLKSAFEYYEQSAAINFLPTVQVPMLIVTALDDHWVSAESYLNFDWSQNPNLKPMVTNTGGHCGFHEQGHNSTWFDRQCLELITQVYC